MFFKSIVINLQFVFLFLFFLIFFFFLLNLDNSSMLFVFLLLMEVLDLMAILGGLGIIMEATFLGIRLIIRLL
jgi:hypothetical protein